MFGPGLAETPHRATLARHSIFLAVISEPASVPIRTLAGIASAQADQPSAFGVHRLRGDAVGQPHGISLPEAGKHQLLAGYPQPRFERFCSEPRLRTTHDDSNYLEPTIKQYERQSTCKNWPCCCEPRAESTICSQNAPSQRDQ